MPSIQMSFNDLLEVKRKIKEINTEYKDNLTQTKEYQIICEKINRLKEEKKQIEFVTQSDMGSRYAELEELKAEKKGLQQMITDMSINNLVKGEYEEITDENGKVYNPDYNVDYK